MNAHDSEKLSETLRALARDMEQNCQAPPRLEPALLAAFRRQRARSAWRRRVVVGGIAASLAFLMLAAMWMRLEAPPPPSAPATVALEAPPAAPVLETPEEPAPPPAPRVRRGRALRPAPSRPLEVLTGFLPVLPGGPLEPLDRGRMVRVRLPRSALTAFGLPMNEDRAAERVQADVLIGEDGLARAIRFVNYRGN